MVSELVDYYMRHGYTLAEAEQQAELDRPVDGTYDVLLRSNKTGEDYTLRNGLTPAQWDEQPGTVTMELTDALDDYMTTLPGPTE